MKITINGHEYHREKPTISYEEIADHVLGEVPGHLLTVAYNWRGPGDMRRSGTIAPGESIEVADGMTISAYNTGNA